MFRDIRSALLAVFASISANVTAGGSGDATEIVGSTINIQTLASRPSSVVFDVPCRAVLAATKTLVVVGKIQQSIDGSTWTDVTASATLLTLTGGSGGTTEVGIARLSCDLQRPDCLYVRARFTPDLNASSTDTAVIGHAVANFYGLANEPGN